jgi:hypothetical protein
MPITRQVLAIVSLNSDDPFTTASLAALIYNDNNVGYVDNQCVVMKICSVFGCDENASSAHSSRASGRPPDDRSRDSRPFHFPVGSSRAEPGQSARKKIPPCWGGIR